ncbi:hypothetical protein OBO34_19640 [Clostridiales Family XIII bacterium ASD5510]|uniref:Uncharacterized protein n=1 Tax=Hominibacterium faecale TaxID=2839743 RepID=A0A9J6QYF5_9FIRM|nr:hypothetical protein [Hominibacterium faecale]MCU7380529.1 hypothetical protein [Hominibacterium faecale]
MTGIQKLNKILQVLLSNPIVEETTVDDWIVRRYANGKAEAFYTYTPTLSAINTQKGSMYCGANATRALPAGIFTKIYQVTTTFTHGGTGPSGVGIRSYDTTAIVWYVWAATSWASGQKATIGFRVEGTWK